MKDKVACFQKNSTESEERKNSFSTYEVSDFYHNKSSSDEGILFEKLELFLEEVEFKKMNESEKSFVLNSIQNLT